MRLQLLFLLSLRLSSAFGQDDVARYEIEDKLLFNVLAKLADTINWANNGKGLMEINFDIPTTRTVYAQPGSAPDTLSFDFTEKSLKIGLGFLVIARSDIWRVPTAYTMINDVPCTIFTGIETLMKHEQEPTIKRLKKKFKDRIVGIVKDQMWFVILRNDSVSIQPMYKKP